ncbi:hypothetical protein DFH09DRAFT_1153106 [Mycena vulgaris]|nr:hypothetical protein DFH09DRAFT_1153106 [Mycena vulgaris]
MVRVSFLFSFFLGSFARPRFSLRVTPSPPLSPMFLPRHRTVPEADEPSVNLPLENAVRALVRALAIRGTVPLHVFCDVDALDGRGCCASFSARRRGGVVPPELLCPRFRASMEAPRLCDASVAAQGPHRALAGLVVEQQTLAALPRSATGKRMAQPMDVPRLARASASRPFWMRREDSSTGLR